MGAVRAAPTFALVMLAFSRLPLGGEAGGGVGARRRDGGGTEPRTGVGAGGDVLDDEGLAVGTDGRDADDAVGDGGAGADVTLHQLDLLGPLSGRHVLV